jgi:hypothetical protein
VNELLFATWAWFLEPIDISTPTAQHLVLAGWALAP